MNAQYCIHIYYESRMSNRRFKGRYEDVFATRVVFVNPVVYIFCQRGCVAVEKLSQFACMYSTEGLKLT